MLNYGVWKLKINMIGIVLNMKKPIRYFCTNIRPIKKIPFVPQNMSQIPYILGLKPDKQYLQNIFKSNLQQICPNKSQAQAQFQQANRQVKNLYKFIKDTILNENDPELNPQFFEKAQYYFQKEGKKVRPIMVEMMARNFLQIAPQTTAIIKDKVFLWSALIEMMHIASLAHDDVVDDSPSRRGQQSQHIKYGSRTAIFSGNYIISRASKAVSEFNSKRLYEIYANSMESLAEGQIKQLISKGKYTFMKQQPDRSKGLNSMLERYMEKTYYKSAALMSNSLLGVPTIFYENIGPNIQQMFMKKFQDLQDLTFKVGQHYGLALQLVDDILDYISTVEQMGKQGMSDLIQGNVTAPVFFTFYHKQNLLDNSQGINFAMLNKKKKNKQQAYKIKQWVDEGVGIELTYIMAAKHIQVGLQTLKIIGFKEQIIQGWRHLGYKLLTRRK